jgi:hypothetical protein
MPVHEAQAARGEDVREDRGEPPATGPRRTDLDRVRCETMSNARGLPTSIAGFRKASWWKRFWWGVRYKALDVARAAKVDADVEAALRNAHQLSRTVLVAVCFTSVLTLADSLLLHHSFSLQGTWAAFALAMAQVGAYLALRRSNETRAYLGEVRQLLHELGARSILSSAISYAREIGECPTPEDLRRRATAILSHLKDSRLFPKAVEAFSVWAHDDVRNEWRIVAALGASEETIENFRQPVLDKETPGAGVVANLAVTASVNSSYYQASAEDPKGWFKADPAAMTRTETLAVFLLPDERGYPVGAFALTSAQPDALEADAQGRASERVSLIIDQCSLILLGVARKAHELWKGTVQG